MKGYLVISHLKIQNANALSSPYTIGFPAMTSWLGGVHALQRKLNQSGFEDLKFMSVAVCSHRMDLQTFRGPGDFHSSIIGTSNPLNAEGKRTSFIEEARCHLDVSLVIEYESKDELNLELIRNLLYSGLKIAGGDILNLRKLIIFNEEEKDRVMRRLMPGYVVVGRQDLMNGSDEDPMTTILDYLTLQHRSEQNDKEEITWTSKRKIAGWILPIAVGFYGVTPLGRAKNQRDPDKPHCFAESIVTLGEFIMPYRIKDIDMMLWHYDYNSKDRLYLCKQNKPYEITNGEVNE